MNLFEEPFSLSDPIDSIIAAGVAAKTSDENHIVVPQGYQLTTRLVEQFEAIPRRKRASLKLGDVQSFCAYINQHKPENPNLLVTCSFAEATFVCIFDYHGVMGDARAWGEHRASLTLTHTREWKVWESADKVKRNQFEFGEFLEQNASDVIRPEGAALFEICMDVTAKRDVDFQSASRIQNGQVEFKYVERTTAQPRQGTVALPERFTLRIPIFQGAPEVDLDALLRYRVQAGGLTLWYELLRPRALVERAIQLSIEDISERIDCPVLNGNVASMGL